MLLEGKTALVTGGANGIGAAIVERLRIEGAKVLIVDRAEVDLAGLRADGAPGKGEVHYYQCDVTDAARIDEVCRSATADHGPIPILVNDAGGSGNTKALTIFETSDEIWQHVMDLNLTSTLRFCRAIAPGMRDAGYGRIINLSSIVRYGIAGPGPTMFAHYPYVVSKAAISALTTQMAKELGPYGITVNAVAPGLILPGEDARVTKNFHTLPEEARERIRSGVPMRRFGNGADIASITAFLASEQSEYLTAQTIDVDGGI